jgi:hypothetical protein
MNIELVQVESVGIELSETIRWGRESFRSAMNSIRTDGGLEIGTVAKGVDSAASLAEMIKKIEGLLHLDIIPKDGTEIAAYHLPSFIAAILEELQYGATNGSLVDLEAHLKIPNRSGDPIDDRLDYILGVLEDKTPGEQAIKDVIDLISEILIFDGDHRKKLEALHFALSRINNQGITDTISVYTEAHASVISA